MEKIIYYSRNDKKPPFIVTIEINGQLVFINCNCPLGIEKKICRHKINAIRADRENKHSSTSDEVITKLKKIFGTTSTVRKHLEEKWRLLREFSSQNPENEEEISNKRRILGEAFANGFLNENIHKIREPFDSDEWEAGRETYVNGLKCPVILKYTNNEGIESTRDVIVEEIFISNSRFYILGFCNLRNQKRTFRVDRIHGIEFGNECTKQDMSLLLNIIFQGNII